MHVWTVIKSQLQAQRGHLMHWVPIALSLGIGLYFSLRSEPEIWLMYSLVMSALAGLSIGLYRKTEAFPLVAYVCLFALGFGAAGVRANLVAAPKIEAPFHGWIDGRIIKIDRSASDAVRLTLDQVYMPALAASETPHKIRISLHAKDETLKPMPRDFIRVKAWVYPLSGPVEPGGFDFQRYAWFQGLGGVGFSKAPAYKIAVGARKGFTIDHLRARIAQMLKDQLGERLGGVAAAITTGDRSAIPKPVLETLRVTNLAHLLAISGLHMGLLVSVVFMTVRGGVALWPWLVLRINGKKCAAAVAILAACFYLMISGAGIATQRAFIMAVVALTAILLERRALSLRTVTVAATVILLLWPESLLSPGFQMSFAATTALVWVFSYIRFTKVKAAWARWVAALFLSSTVAGAATAPFAAAHFNIFAQYGLIANLLAVPVMASLVMPAAVLSAILAPLGGGWIGVEVMGHGLQWILFVADQIGQISNAATRIKGPPPWVLPLLSGAFLWLILWQGRVRFLAILLICAGFVGWHHTPRPDILIADNGKMVGVLGPEGRVLSREKGQGFVASVWLENDGDAVPQLVAAQRAGVVSGGVAIDAQQHRFIWNPAGKRALARFEGCEKQDILVVSQVYERDVPCRVFDKSSLDLTGSVAIYLQDDKLRVHTVSETRGARLWVPTAQK